MLVVTQFAISQMLIIGTVVAISQMSFARNADLGFNKDAVFIMQVNADSTFRSNLQSFKEELLQQPGIQSVSFSTDAVFHSMLDYQHLYDDHHPDEILVCS